MISKPFIPWWNEAMTGPSPTCEICGCLMVRTCHDNIERRNPGWECLSCDNYIADAKEKEKPKESTMTDETPEPQPEAPQQEAPSTFERDIAHVINRHSKENGSDTPDFILAAYLQNCLNAFNHAVQWRAAWYSPNGVPVEWRQTGPAPTEPQPEPEPINYVTTNPYCRGMGTQTDPGRP
jgi:hypothetical protein